MLVDRVRAVRELALSTLKHIDALAEALRGNIPHAGARAMREIHHVARTYQAENLFYDRDFESWAEVSHGAIDHLGTVGPSVAEWSIRWAWNITQKAGLAAPGKLGLGDRPTTAGLCACFPELRTQLSGLAQLQHAEIEELVTSVEREGDLLEERLAAKTRLLPRPEPGTVFRVMVTQTPPGFPTVGDPTAIPTPTSDGEPVAEKAGHIKGLAVGGIAILQFLVKMHPHTYTQVDLAAHIIFSRRTIQKHLKKLEKLGLVCRPNGPRSGVTITTHGRKAIEHLPVDCALLARYLRTKK